MLVDSNLLASTFILYISKMNEVSLENLNKLLDDWNAWNPVPRECFFAYNPASNSYVCADNTTNDFRMEEFKDWETAKSRMEGEFEMSDLEGF